MDELTLIKQQLEIEIEARKKAEEEVQKLNVQLQEALKSAKNATKIKEQFLSNMSHEIRTPLNSIIGFVDVMLIHDLDKIKREKYLNILKKSGQNLLKILSDILDFSKIQNGDFVQNKKLSYLKDSMIKCTSSFKTKVFNKNINYKVDISDDFPQILIADESKIIQVLEHLIDNAIKFTPANGTIEVSFDYDYSSSIMIAKIKDNGIGVDESKQETIFLPFEQEDNSTSREYGGNGLGLSISSSLVKIMDGEFIFESKKGEGSLFGFKLPLKIPDAKK